MNKGQGVFAGAILAAALLLRPLGVNAPSGSDVSSASQTLPGLQANGSNKAGAAHEGPWLASCNYWAPVRLKNNGDEIYSSPKTEYRLPEEQIADAIQGANKSPEDFGCGNDAKNVKRWGLPDSTAGNQPKPDITAIIAIVRDPVHTHLALGFDRSIQVLLQAASDSGYLSSSYWLPWRPNSSTAGGSQPSGAKEPGHDAAREREPGLIILKHVPAGDGEYSESQSFDKVIYLFLVAETPTEGIDGFQFRKALQYESNLNGIVTNKKLGGTFSQGPEDKTAIIGPTSSGSTASLRAAIDASIQQSSKSASKPPEPSSPKFLVAGATETSLAVDQLKDPEGKVPSPVEYFSFAPHVSHNLEAFLSMAEKIGNDLSRVAILYEDDSIYGSKGLHGLAQIQSFDPYGKILYMSFPREISLLRNAPVDSGSSSGAAGSGSVPSPYLHFSVKDSSGLDSVLQFSQEHSRLSQESQLMAIARELNHRRTRLIALSATDTLDQIFLAQFFRRACPDARLVFVESDLLMARDVDNLPYIGSITITPYSFVTRLSKSQGEGDRIYTDTDSEALYNAARFVFLDADSLAEPDTTVPGSSEPAPGTAAPTVGMTQLGNARRWAGQVESPLDDYRLIAIDPASSKPIDPVPPPYPPPTNYLLQPPPLWATTLGTDGYYPLALITPCASDSSDYNAGEQKPHDPEFDSHLLPVIEVTPKGVFAQEALCDQWEANERIRKLFAPSAPEKASAKGPRSGANSGSSEAQAPPLKTYASVYWEALCAGVGILCLFHALLLCIADSSSPVTHDLAVRNNAEAPRRSLYIQISTAMLGSMAGVLAIPLLVLSHVIQIAGQSQGWAWFAIISGSIAILAGLGKIWGNADWSQPKDSPAAIAPADSKWAISTLLGLVRHASSFSAAIRYVFLSLLGLTIAFGISGYWYHICMGNDHLACGYMNPPNAAATQMPTPACPVPAAPAPYVEYQFRLVDLVGLSFAYRCLYPESGVAPVVPVLLLLFGWYMWGIFQTWRMRFSRPLDEGPWLPRKLDSQEVKDDGSGGPLFVSEDDLGCTADREDCDFAANRKDRGLYENITCLLITQNLIRRVLGFNVWLTNLTLGAIFAVVLCCFAFHRVFWSIDDFFSGAGGHRSAPFVLLLDVLFLPLFWCTCAGWLRLVAVWNTLKKGLLGPLENLPIRFAFSRLKGKGWMTILARVGLLEQKRDVERCIESIRQMPHLSDFNKISSEGIEKLKVARESVLGIVASTRVRTKSGTNPEATNNSELRKQIRKELADYGHVLLKCVLIPYWEKDRTGLVESEEAESLPIKARRSDYEMERSRIPMELHAGPPSEAPPRIVAAEEFLAMRYMALFRAVLENMRYLMTFVSLTFVLTIVAWNSYPFQPRQLVDWIFTAVLAFLGLGGVWVFAQMHRDPILSRVTATKPNELGLDFYVRIVSFGAIPAITWLAYEFPDVGSAIYRFLQPGTSVFR